MGFFANFRWAVPYAFSDAVGFCRFEEGDVLYDTKNAYVEDWGKASNHITHCIQVRYPGRAGAGNRGGGAGVFEKNWNSEVRIELYEHQEKVGVGQLATTQGRLYTTLWKGDLDVLNVSTDVPSLPLDVKHVTKQLVELKAKEICPSVGNQTFVMARDQSNQVSRDKYLKVSSKLKKLLTSPPEIMTPKKAGLSGWGNIAPTIEIAFFYVKEVGPKGLESLVKDAVYVPSKGAKKDMFRMQAHGVILE